MFDDFKPRKEARELLMELERREGITFPTSQRVTIEFFLEEFLGEMMENYIGEVEDLQRDWKEQIEELEEKIKREKRKSEKFRAVGVTLLKLSKQLDEIKEDEDDEEEEEDSSEGEKPPTD